MLTILNNYMHGYVAVPVILACKKHGLFRTLHFEKTVLFADLVQKLHANSGHLRAALHMLESLQGVSRNSKDEYVLLPESGVFQKIPEEIIQLLSFPMNSYLKGEQKGYRLEKWIELSSRRWDVENRMFADFLDGMLVIPLLLALKEAGFLDSSDDQKEPFFLKLNPAVREVISALFVNQGWLSQDKGTPVLTETGRFIAGRIFITATVASYRPMLTNISEVLFGDCKSVFERDVSGYEQHVDRTLNVRGSGFQHERYFSDMEEIILSLFNRTPYAEQPHYVADTGCGDGRLLKQFYEIIKNKSLRGNVLDEYPVKLIGIDFNEKALEETARTLKDIDHIVLKGDIGDPEQIIKDLKNNGIQDTENILHVRSFLDHDRPYVQPMDTSAEKARSTVPYPAVCVDREGREIPATAVMQSLVEHLKRWATVVGNHGLILLEVHCLEPGVVGTVIDKCENLHFDLYHRFSQQLLIEADQFLLAAAEASLFSHHDFFKRYPKTLPFSRITLNNFERRDYCVRYARESDLPALNLLEQKCWQPGLRASDSILQKRLQRYPEGQFVLEMAGNVVGVIYSQRIIKQDDLYNISLEAVEKLHRPEGSIVQLLGMNILPEVQHKSLGDQLLEFMLQRCRLMDGVHAVVGITRCKDYHRHKDIALQEYVNLQNEQGKRVDPTLRFHELHGATIGWLIPDYRPNDTMNEGCGVLIEYNLDTRQRDDIDVDGKYPEMTAQAEITKETASIKEFIAEKIMRFLGKTKEKGFSLERPLMEMGLDSADLLELNEQIRFKYRISLEPAFFFEHNTGAGIVSYLQKHVEGGRGNIETSQEGTDQIQRGRKRQVESESVVLDSSTAKKEIAIIGVACRLPGGATNKEVLWELLSSNKDLTGKIPLHRWTWPHTIDPENEHRGIDRGGFIDGIALFDAGFFRIAPKEAELMDPQQRILLELSWECLEDAGYPATAVSGSKTGVFIGASGSDYNKILDRYPEKVEAHYGSGISLAALPNRLSYFYDFHGPSLQIDTACSSSLVAIHEAVKSIQGEECELAFVGGINIMCHPANSIAYYKAGMLSKEGRCKTFDKEADGYARGEGAIMVLLKPLQNALRDQDSILAVIKGTAINHGGQAAGLTVPNPAKQASLLIETHKAANFLPETVGYIEAHGTGTSLGDPIEISGLRDAFFELSKTQGEAQVPYCGLGSIKTNIGHLEAAAGMAGLLKVLLSMQYKTLPASLHFNELNPNTNLTKTPFYIVNKNQPWHLPDGQSLRRAGVSSFGSGGTNAHVVLEEAPVIKRNANGERPGYLICLSAKTEEALKRRESDLAQWLEKKGQQYTLSDISATLLFGREHFGIRAAYVVSDVQELQVKLKDVSDNGRAEGYFRESGTKKGKQLQPSFGQFGQSILMELHAGEKISKGEYGDKLSTLAELYTQGYDLGWKALFAEGRKSPVPLPSYPFARDRYWVLENRGERTEGRESAIDSLRCQNVSSISKQRGTPRDPLQPLAVTESNFSHTVDKPTGISLPSLSDDQIQTSKPLDQPQHTVTLPSTDSSLLQLRTNDESIPAICLQKAVSREELVVDLVSSLTEALNMKPGDIDVDAKFTDLGLDSIIGVEWIRAVNKSYGLSIAATKVYDYPTIHEFAGFLEGELINHKGGQLRQSLEQSTSPPSLDELIQQVHSGTLDVEQADQLFKSSLS